MTTSIAPMPTRPSIPTRPSLLERLRTGDDVAGWEEFYRLYGDLLRAFARKAGLTEAEAEDVVQETAIGVARHLPEFRYDPAVCSFRTWMLNLAHWRILDQLRRRGGLPGGPGAPARTVPRRSANPEAGDATGGTKTVERVPDPHPADLAAEWDAAWEEKLWKAALERLRERVPPKQFQIFDLYALKGQPAGQVARRLGVNVARVYLTKARLGARLRREAHHLELEMAKLTRGTRGQ
jgi:RNA polymerase sigma-70 factor (ECF subfamily)